MRERPDDVTRFLAAEIAAARFAVAHRAETIALTREVTGAKADDPRPEFVFDETVSKREFDPDVPIPMDKLAWMQGKLVKTGNVRQAMDLNRLVAPGGACQGIRLGGELVLPETLEPRWRQLGVAHRVLDVPMPEIGSQRSGIDAIIRDLEAAGVSRAMRWHSGK